MSLSFYGDEDWGIVTEADAFETFKNMLLDFMKLLKTKESPIDWRQTVEMARVVIAGTRSLEQGNRVVCLSEIE